MTFMILVPIGLIILVLALLVEAVERLIAWAVLLVVGYFLLTLVYEYAQKAEQLLMHSWIGTLPSGVQLAGLVLGACAVGLVVGLRDAGRRWHEWIESKRLEEELADERAGRKSGLGIEP